MEQLAAQLLHHLAAHPDWALLFVFLISFLESLALVGSVVPAAACLFIAGTLVGAGQLAPWPTLGWSILGAVLGDGISYWIGYRYREQIRKLWPFTRYPGLLGKGEAFFAKHGGKSVAMGRFIGPIRAMVPVIAGMVGMVPARFYLMNILSALIWGPAHLLPGILFGASLRFAGEMVTRLTVFFIILATILWAIIWLLKVLIGRAAPHLGRMRDAVLQRASTRQTVLSRLLISLLHPDHPASPTLFIAALSFSLGVWIFANALELMLGKGALASIDTSVFNFMQSVRVPLLDHVAASISGLGGAVTLGCLFTVALLWLLWHRRFTSALYWVVANAVGLFLVPFLGTTLGSLAPAGEHALLPVGPHVTLSMVAYGFLALMIGRELRGRVRLVLSAATAALVALIALARIYLGTHHLTDAVGGIGLGLAWASMVGIAYSYHERGALRARGMLLAALLAILVATLWQSSHPLPVPPLQHSAQVAGIMDEDDWLADGWRRMPAWRTGITGNADDPFLLQIAGNARNIERHLMADGWTLPLAGTPANMLQWANPKAPLLQLPALPRLFDGKSATLTLVRGVTGQPSVRLILRLWPSGYEIYPATSGAPVPLWLGTLSMEQIRHPLAAINVAISEHLTTIDPADFTCTLDGHGVWRLRTSHSHPESPPLSILLVPAD